MPSNGRTTHVTGALVQLPEQILCWRHGAASEVTGACHGSSMTASKDRLTIWAVVGIVAKLGAQDAEGLASGTGAVPGEVAPLPTVEALFRRRLEASLVEVPARGHIRLSPAAIMRMLMTHAGSLPASLPSAANGSSREESYESVARATVEEHQPGLLQAEQMGTWGRA